MLHNDSIKSSLEKLHQNFIVTLIDEVDGNNAVICKRYCSLTLFKELGLR